MTSSDHLATPYGALEPLLEALPDPAILIALQHRKIVAANTLATTFLDRDTSTLQNAEPSDIRDPQDRVAFSQALEQLTRLAVPPSVTLEESLVGAHGTTTLVLSQIRSFEFQGARHALHIFRPLADDSLTSAATLRETVAQLPLPVMLAEPDRPQSIYLNAACARLFGVDTSQEHPVDPSQRPWRICRPDGTPVGARELPAVRVLQRAETCGPEELLIVPVPPAKPRIMSVVSAPVRRTDGELLAAVATMMDIDNLHSLEADLHEAREAVQRDARRNGAFYASLSRELRNPLTSILGYLDLIADPESPEGDRAVWFAQIRKSGESLMNLVQDLVDLGQMEAGTFQLEKDSFSTSLALAHVISQARARAQQRDRDVIARYTTPVPRTLTLDPVRFRQCLSTLMHFVIENTSRGDITLQAAVIGNGDERRLAFDVSSHSRDLVQADLDPLFDPFRPTTPRARPWSLAFPVARRIAQMMGGTIECGLDPDRVWFRLTIQPAEHDFSRMAHLSLPDEEQRPPSTHPPMRLRGTVLLVEDNEADRLLVTKMLERSGLHVDFVTGGEEVLERPVHRYDAILMDLELPDMDGLEATRRLRAEGTTVPIVALTASVLTGDRERCLDAGCTAYVPKPIDRPMLLRTLDGLISTTEDRRVLSVLPPGLASVEPLSSTREDDPSLLQILPQFVTRMSRFVDHIARSTRDRELTTATKTARSLGATADNCGFPPLADAANAVAEACSRPLTDDDEIKHCLEDLEQVTRRIQAAYPQSIPPSG